MERNGDSQQDENKRSRVHKSSEVHKRRLDKETRRAMRQREREVARDQVQRETQAEAERQERFTVIHGGRDADHQARSRMRDSLAARVPNPNEPPSSSGQVGQASEQQKKAIPITVISAGSAHGVDLSAPNGASNDETAAGVSAEASVPGDSSEAALDDNVQPYGAAGHRRAAAAETRRFGRDAAKAAGLAADDAPEDSSLEDASDGEIGGKPPKRPSKLRRIIFIVIAIIVGIVLILFGLFSWNRWLRYDDAVEIQGEWFAANSGRRAPITIDGDVVVFNPETKWHYTLDTTAKTISFTFGSQTGGGRYWFAGDHQHLIIEDGISFSAFDTFMADLQRTLTGKADEIPQGETVTVLSRSADAIPESDASAEATSADVAPLEDTSAAIESEGPSEEEALEDAADDGSGEPAATEDGQSEEEAPGEESFEGESGADDAENWSVEDVPFDEGADQAEESHA